MATPAVLTRGSARPARQLTLLATWAPGAAVVFALLAAWSVVTTVLSLGRPFSVATVVSVVVGVLVAVVAGRTAYRLGVGVPRVLRAWEAALAERAEVVGGPRAG